MTDSIIRQTYVFIKKSQQPVKSLLFLSLLLFLLDMYSFRTLRRIPLLGTAVQGVSKIYSALVQSNLDFTPISFPSNRNSTLYTGIALIPNNSRYRTKNLIVGSGPGGAIAALSCDEDTVILEKGQVDSFPNHDKQSISHVFSSFHAAGQEVCFSKPPVIFSQGSVVGGGSEVNSGLYHKLPDGVLEKWIEKCDTITKEEFRSAEHYVREFLKVSKPGGESLPSLIKLVADQSGLEFERINRWRTYSESGFVHHGLYDSIWKDPERRLLPGIEARKISRSNKRLSVECVVVDSHGKKTVVFECERLVLSCGTTQTPRILIKSGLVERKSVRFNFHPMVRAVVRTETVYQGASDVDFYQAWTGNHTFKIGGAVSTPTLLAFALDRKLTEEDSKLLRSIYVSFELEGKGGFAPLALAPYFRFSTRDKEMIRLAFSNLTEFIARTPGVELLSSEKEAISRLSTVHIFGSLPLGSNFYKKGSSSLLVDPRIMVLDASIIPSAPTVNPQGPLMALSKLMVNK